MPVIVLWDDEPKTVIRWNYEGQWTWEEVTCAFEQAIQMMRSVQHPVAMIHDLTRSGGMPRGALANAYRYTTALPENWTFSVVVDSGGLAEALLNIFRKLYKKLGEQYKTAPTLDEARKLIARQKTR